MAAWPRAVRQIFRSFENISSFPELRDNGIPWGRRPTAYLRLCFTDIKQREAHSHQTTENAVVGRAVTSAWGLSERGGRPNVLHTSHSLTHTLLQHMQASEQCMCKGLWPPAPVSFQTERECEVAVHSRPFYTPAWGEHLHNSVTANAEETRCTEVWDIKPQSSTTLDFILFRSHVPIHLHKRLFKTLVVFYVLNEDSTVCSTDLTNPPQLSCCAHFPPILLFQVNSSPSRNNRTIENARLNDSNLTSLKHSESGPNITPRAQIQFQCFKYIHYWANEPPSKKQRTSSAVHMTEFLVLGPATSSFSMHDTVRWLTYRAHSPISPSTNRTS